MTPRRAALGIASVAVVPMLAGGCSSPAARSSASSTTSTTARPTAPSSTVPHPSTTTSSSSTLPPTSTTAAGATSAALIPVLQAFFSAGCNGVCTALTEPATAFSVTLDQHDPSWARWSVVDPSVGSGYGFAHAAGSQWAVVAGPGSAGVGCPPSTAVPRQVLSDFGSACP